MNITCMRPKNFMAMLFSGLLFLTLFSANNAFAQGQIPGNYIVGGVPVGGTLNVRSRPSGQSGRVGGVKYGQVVEVLELGPNGLWGRINYNGGDGWIYYPYLKPAASGATAAPTQVESEPVQSTGIGAYTVTGASSVNVRSRPSSKAGDIGGVLEGEVVQILEVDRYANWGRIDYRGRAGWVYLPLLTPTGQSTPQPSEQAVSVGTSPQAESTDVYVVSGVDAVNIRSRASSDSADIGSVLAGEVISVLEVSSNGSWGRISYDGKDGWVYMKFLKPTTKSVEATAETETQPEEVAEDVTEEVVKDAQEDSNADQTTSAQSDSGQYSAIECYGQNVDWVAKIGVDKRFYFTSETGEDVVISSQSPLQPGANASEFILSTGSFEGILARKQCVGQSNGKEYDWTLEMKENKSGELIERVGCCEAVVR